MTNEELLARMKIPVFHEEKDLLNFLRKELGEVGYDTKAIGHLYRIWCNRVQTFDTLEDMYQDLELIGQLIITLPKHVYLALFDINLAPGFLVEYMAMRSEY